MILPNPSQTHLLFNLTHISIWLLSVFSRGRLFLPTVSVVKWLVLGELTLGAVPAPGGGHLATCTDISERASQTGLVVSGPWFTKGQRLWILHATLGDDSH